MTSGQTKATAPAPPSSPPLATDAMDAFDGTEEVVKISGGGKTSEETFIYSSPGD